MKKSNIKFSLRRAKRAGRIRRIISGTSARPRLSVYRSLNHLYAQLVDDGNRRTLLSLSTKSKDLQSALGESKGKCAPAKVLGVELAKRAKDMNITTVVFDRKGYLYHGRVKALADGVREGGLQF